MAGASWAQGGTEAPSTYGAGWKTGQLSEEVDVAEPDDDRKTLATLVEESAAHFGYDTAQILAAPFVKLFRSHLRPYGQLYAY